MDTVESIATSGEGAAPWAQLGRHVYTADEPPTLPVGVIFESIVYGGTGYADIGWAEALGVARHNVPLQLVPIGDSADVRHILPPGVRQALERLQQERVDPARSILFQGAMAYLWNMDRYGRRRIGHTMFETDRLPDGWAERCNAMDEVWVPTQFNFFTFAGAGVDERRLRVLPLGVDTTLFRPGCARFNWPPARGFRFLSNFDLQDRKGMDLLLRAYLAEFRADEDVCLVLKISQHSDPALDPEAILASFVEREAGLTLQNSPPIILIKGFIPQSEMPRLYASADAFVLPTHGEGFGRPYIEALASGLPVIATRWSGHLDFLNDINSDLIDVEGMVPASLDVESFAGHFWAQPSLEHLRQLMRNVYQHPGDARARAEAARDELVASWDWTVVIERWVAEFRRLLDS